MKIYLPLLMGLFAIGGIWLASPSPSSRDTQSIRGREQETPAPQVTDDSSIYDPDPHHLWNRLFRQFYVRIAQDGREFGQDALDPLLWLETRYLLEGASYDQAISLLDEFLDTHAENLVSDPLKRALLQRDLWAVFDWVSRRSDDYPQQRGELQKRLAQVIRRLALAETQIAALPDNYQSAVASGSFPEQFQPEQSQTAYLPPDLFQANNDWINVGREGGPAAFIHVMSPFSGRSVFLVFLHLPGGRRATLDYLRQLRETKHLSQATPLPTGTQVALVRRLMLINDRGEITPTTLTESVQIRFFRAVYGNFQPEQRFFEFNLSRTQLFAGKAGGLHPVAPGEKEFLVFGAHEIDYFELEPTSPEIGQAVTLSLCLACHQGSSVESFETYSRYQFPLLDQKLPLLIETTPSDEAQVTIGWKQDQDNWQRLRKLWDQE